ncbi:MAG: TM0106 family RecB-like putative nuclease [Acidobacteria bacterium]|nr:TM0106 family RecB-like putative nuclease [Acidobacteriota bacterium]MCW5947975.1 TM0106 family RecB-like putative nuclease [Pyrinomonadaceae bacterium]
MPVITPSLLYDHMTCPHRVWRDVHGPLDERVDEDNPFLRLLWERGVQHEADVVAGFGFEMVDCSLGTEEERIAATHAAIDARAEYIYQGILAHGDLFGIPDILHFDGVEYIPIEIKSGSADESGDDGEGVKPRKDYAVQLALYCELLERRGVHSSYRAAVIDTTGERVDYDLTAPQGTRTPETFLELYHRIRAEVVALLANEMQNSPAMSSKCKDCGWYASCSKWVKETDDLTQLFYVGRSIRDTMQKDLGASSVEAILNQDRGLLLEKKKADKTFLRGIGGSTLEKIFRRGELMRSEGEPLMLAHYEFPEVTTEIFFDIESDPTRDLVYLHGFWVRSPDSERFVEFTARAATPEAERDAWAGAIHFLRSFDPDDTAVYYYSAYERTSYRRLRRKFPDVIVEDELEAMFAHRNFIDLYLDIILPSTEWPLGAYSVKAIAPHLGFKWRDETPSGALSIQWFNEFLTTGDEAKLRRILEYNEDDCKATVVVKDYLKQRMDEMKNGGN